MHGYQLCYSSRYPFGIISYLSITQTNYQPKSTNIWQLISTFVTFPYQSPLQSLLPSHSILIMKQEYVPLPGDLGICFQNPEFRMELELPQEITPEYQASNRRGDKSYVFRKNSIKNIVGMFIQFKEELVGDQYLDHILGVKQLESVPKKGKLLSMKVRPNSLYLVFLEEFQALFVDRRQKGLKYNSELVLEICQTRILRPTMLYFMDKVADFWLMYRSKIKEDNKLPYRNAIAILKQAILNNEKPKFKKLTSNCQFESPEVPPQLRGLFESRIRKVDFSFSSNRPKPPSKRIPKTMEIKPPRKFKQQQELIFLMDEETEENPKKQESPSLNLPELSIWNKLSHSFRDESHITFVVSEEREVDIFDMQCCSGGLNGLEFIL